VSVPTWSVGQVLTASDVNTWLVPAEAVKQNDQSTTSASVANDNELLLSVAANAEYRFECWLSWVGVVAAGIQWTWTVPSGAGLVYQPLHNEGGGTGLNNSATTYADTDTVTAVGTSPTVAAVLMKGTLQTGSSSGTIRLKWGQGTANGSATHVRSLSCLELQRSG
jgi:hypothetical protein